MPDSRTEIKKALEQLGYENPDPDIAYIDPHHLTVDLNGVYMGTWNTVKKAFVD